MTDKIQLKPVLQFTKLLFSHGRDLLCHALCQPKNIDGFVYKFSELYSDLMHYSEFSISHSFYDLPLALGEGGVHTINQRLAQFYGCRYACLTYGGSSTALLSMLTCVLPRLCAVKDVLVIDTISHQSVVGAAMIGRWSVATLERDYNDKHGSASMLRLADVKRTVTAIGAERIGAFVIVNSTYDGFYMPHSEAKAIYDYLKSQSILLIMDGAWTAMWPKFSNGDFVNLNAVADCVVTSLHKKSFGGAGSAACITCNDPNIAAEIDIANDLGFRTTSPSAVTTFVTEHRLLKLLNGELDDVMQAAVRSARIFKSRVTDIHPEIYVVTPKMMKTNIADPLHILISTSNLSVDARHWAKRLQSQHNIIVEKASRTGILFLWGADKSGLVDEITQALKTTLSDVLAQKLGDQNA